MPGLNPTTLFIHAFVWPIRFDASLPALVPAAKGAGGKPFPSAPDARTTSPGYVWPEFTMGECPPQTASMQRVVHAGDL